MAKQLYFDISGTDSGGSLYRVEQTDGISFLYNHSVYNEASDEVTVYDTWYTSFEAFWKMLTSDPQWYYRHPLFVHPEKREFVQEELKRVDWAVQGDKKWQESHQRQWRKVL